MDPQGNVSDSVPALGDRAVRLEGGLQRYAWGGDDFIADLVGLDRREPRRIAELWIGAHPAAPAVVVAGDGRVPLDRAIAASPASALGPSALRFGGRLPYLLKVLDVRAMLSIQAHPTKAQAEAGFARENAAGVPLTAPNRNYRDDNHKPEALVAVTEFWMLHGFRRVDEILEALTARPALRPLLPWVDRRSDDSPSGPAALQRLYEGVMMMPQPEVDALLEPLLVEIVPRYEAGAIGKSSPDFWAARAALDFAQPDGHRDRGILSIYLLNLVRVPAGCGAFVGPGLLHAHLSGVAIEIMASSDNVLRGGLTTKHVDVPELLRILRFDATPPHLIEAVAVSPSEQVYPVPAAEFALSRIGLGPEATSERVPAEGPDSLLVLEGAVRLRSGSQELAFARGGIAFVPAGRPYVLSTQGGAVVFSASVPAAGGSPSAAGR